MAGGKVNLGFSGKVNVGGGGGKVNLGFGGKVNTSPKAAPTTHHGGGFLGDITGVAHAVASKASLAGRDIEGMPGGIYHLGKDLGKSLTNKAAWEGHAGAYKNLPIDRDAKAMAKQTVESIRHPLRDPFMTALNVAPVVGMVGRVGEAGIAASDAARAGEGLSGAAKAAARASRDAAARPRMLRTPEGEFNLSPPIKGAAGRIGQRVYDKTLQHGLDTNPEGRAAAHANTRIGKQIQEAEAPRQAMRNTESDVLQHAGKALNRNEQAAVRLWARRTSPLVRLASTMRGRRPRVSQGRRTI